MKTKNIIFTRLASLLLIPVLLSSCSVAMAARKEGTTIENVQSARTRGQLLAKGATVLTSERLPNGELVEVYQFKMEKGSTGRAVLYGVLDILSWGTWEIIGTPLELINNENKFFSVKIYFNQCDEILKMELA